MATYRLTVSIETCGGWQSFLVKAGSKKEAIEKFNNGESEFEQEEVDIQSLGEVDPSAVELVDETDIPPVPEPSPWLDQPDTDGNWLFLPDGKSEVFACHLHSETGTRFMTMGVEISAYKGKWQRIPQPTLPGEAS